MDAKELRAAIMQVAAQMEAAQKWEVRTSQSGLESRLSPLRPPVRRVTRLTGGLANLRPLPLERPFRNRSFWHNLARNCTPLWGLNRLVPTTPLSLAPAQPPSRPPSSTTPTLSRSQKPAHGAHERGRERDRLRAARGASRGHRRAVDRLVARDAAAAACGAAGLPPDGTVPSDPRHRRILSTSGTVQCRLVLVTTTTTTLVVLGDWGERAGAVFVRGGGG